MRSMDVNRDGHADLVTAGEHHGSIDYIGVYFSDGTGGISGKAEIPLGDEWSRHVEIVDFDGDGFEDIVSWWVTHTLVFLHDGDAWFKSPIVVDIWGPSTAGDVSGDGLTDIVAVKQGSVGPDLPGINISRQRSNGSFRTPERISPLMPGCVDHVLTADLNRDGRRDVIGLHGGSWLTVYLQSQSGTFGPVDQYGLPYATFYDSQGWVIGELNSDNCPDVALADYNHGAVIVYGICEDRNDDGILDMLDFSL